MTTNEISLLIAGILVGFGIGVWTYWFLIRKKVVR